MFKSRASESADSAKAAHYPILPWFTIWWVSMVTQITPWMNCSLYHSRAILKCYQNPFITFWVMLLTDRQTNKQTNATVNMISLVEVLTDARLVIISQREPGITRANVRAALIVTLLITASIVHSTFIIVCEAKNIKLYRSNSPGANHDHYIVE